VLADPDPCDAGVVGELSGVAGAKPPLAGAGAIGDVVCGAVVAGELSTAGAGASSAFLHPARAAAAMMVTMNACRINMVFPLVDGGMQKIISAGK